jgi:hypothetical protein
VIDASPRWILGDLDLTWDGLGVIVDSFNPGASGGNDRTVALTVLVAQPDLAAMAEWQAALDLECAKTWNTLVHDPGEFGAPTRYVVGPASVTTTTEDASERAGWRKVDLSWPVTGWPAADTPTTLTTSGGSSAVTVGGSRPASLSLAVTSGVALGTVIACTQPDMGVPWSPSLRQWVASPNSGSTISAPSTFWPSQNWRASLAPNIPAASVQAGPHGLTGRFYRDSAGTETISWSGPNGQAYSTSVTWDAAGAQIVPLGSLVLDPDDGDAAISFLFSASVYVDDVFAVYLGQYSGLVIVDAGADTGAWVDAPAVENRMLGRVRVGTTYPGHSPGLGLLAASDLPLLPATARLYVATTGTTTPNVVASWHPAVQTHATN